MKPGGIKTMFNPKTIAVIGASEKKGSVGRAILENLMVPSTHRVIYPVNPKRESAMGLKCLSDIAFVPEHIDLAVIATPAATVPTILEKCGQQEVAGAIIISAGFREVGKEGGILEEEVRSITQRYGLRVIGPNCIGVIRPGIGLNASFVRTNLEQGNIAFISHSGAFGGAIVHWAVSNHIGFSMFASLGSMIDIDFGDLIDFLGTDYHTRSIVLYMEGVGDARKFMSAARGFARNKPIIILKPGRVSESTRAASSRASALATDDRVYDAAFKRAGAIRVREVSDLFNSAAVLDSRHLPQGRRLAMVTNTRGFGLMAADTLVELGGSLANLSEASVKELDAFLPLFWSKGNPVDVLGDANSARFVKAIDICLRDQGVDAVLVMYGPQVVLKPEVLAKSVVEIAKTTSKPIIGAWIGGTYVENAREILVRNNIPAYDTPEDAVKTYLYMYRYYSNLALLYETPSDLELREAPPKNHLKASIKRMLREGRTVFTEEESKDFLHIYGIPGTSPALARDISEALRIADRIGYPVVLKVASGNITGKRAVGGVKTGIRSAEELKVEYEVLLKRVREQAPHEVIAGINLQRMVENIDYELIIGAKKDRDFGTVILFGMGGLGAEVFRDVAIGLPPLNQTLARRLMEETKIYRVLQGYDGKPLANLGQIEQILINFSNLVTDFPEVKEIEIDPIALSGGQFCVLNARIVIDADYSESAAQYPHLVIMPYPTKYISLWRLADGTDVTLRPIKPEDEPLELEMLSTLSPETMRTRFFTIIRDISHEMLVRFCNVDYDREMAIVAEIRKEGKRKIIGIGRLIIESDFRSGEYAVLVHDSYHGKGLGYKLMDAIIGVAQDKDLEEIYGIVLKENEKMLRVTTKLGFTIRPLSDEEDMVRVQLALK
jgi:acetyltransferase